MAGLTVCLEVLVIVALFLSGILYYCVLYKFSVTAKRMRPDVWERARLAVPDRAPDLRVAYGLISDRRLGAEVERLDAQSLELYQKARRWLYISTTLFMVVLFYGLYLSLNK